MKFRATRDMGLFFSAAIVFTVTTTHVGTVVARQSLSFEVASIKPAAPAADSNPQGDCVGIDSKPGRDNPGLGRCTFEKMTLKKLVSTAYSPVYPGGRLGFPLERIELPTGRELAWISSQLFDIQAKAADVSAATEAQIYQMFQQLLADRFKLKLRRVTKDGAGYVLSIARSGLKLQVASGKEQRAGMVGGGPPGVRPMSGQAVPIETIVNFLSRRFGRPVLDKTGLTGLYNWELTWIPDDNEVGPDGTPVSPRSPNVVGASLITAVQEQLGLRLESSKVPVEWLVIDSAEKPQPNQ